METKKEIIIYPIIILIFIILSFFIYTLFLYIKANSLLNTYSERIDIRVISLLPVCSGCENTTYIIEKINSNKRINIAEYNIITEMEMLKNISIKYNITKLPAIIIKTENISRINVEGFEMRNDSFVYETTKIPYYDLKSEQEVGKVKVITFNYDKCDVCMDINQIIFYLNQSGVYIESIKEGNAKEFGIKKLPSLAFSDDILAYRGTFLSLAEYLNITIINGKRYFVFKPFPPYYDIGKKRIIGKVNLTYIVDRNCENCYDVTIHKQILQRLGIYIENETYKEYTELNEDIKEKISIIPTVVIEGDLFAYRNLEAVLRQVGYWDEKLFIFTNPKALGLNESTYIKIK